MSVTHMAGVANAAVGVDEPLVGARSQQVELGLLAARTAAVLRRIDEGLTMDDYDRAVIGRAEAMLRGAADAIEFVSSGGKLGSHPQSYSFSAVALTLQATAKDEPDEGDVQSLRTLADMMSSLADPSDSEVVSIIMPVFSALASITTSLAGSSGDSVQFSRFNGLSR